MPGETTSEAIWSWAFVFGEKNGLLKKVVLVNFLQSKETQDIDNHLDKCVLSSCFQQSESLEIKTLITIFLFLGITIYPGRLCTLSIKKTPGRGLYTHLDIGDLSGKWITKERVPCPPCPQLAYIHTYKCNILKFVHKVLFWLSKD